MLNVSNIAAKLLWREWRAGKWNIVFFALLLTVTAITSFHFYTDRLMRGLDQQSVKFLGGDLAVNSSSPIPIAWTHKAKELGLRTAEVWTFPSVARANNQLQLINLQAVSNTYPLLSDTKLRPEISHVWVEPRLLSLLSLHLNQEIMIGSANFSVTKILTSDIDSLNTGWMIAPRILMSLEDLPRTQTVLPGSRIDYRLLLTGNKNQLQQFRTWILPQLKHGQRLVDARTQQFALRNILNHTEEYLHLVLLTCLMMSGVVIALSIRHYLNRHYSHVALWRCLGATKKQIILIFLWQLSFISLLAGIVGTSLGYFAQNIFANLFNEYLQFPLPAAGFAPVILGFFTSTVLLFAFAYPLFSELPNISPLYIWRNEIKEKLLQSNIYRLASIAIILLFLYWLTSFSLLTLFFMNVILVSIGILYALIILLLSLTQKFLVYTDGVIRRGLSQLIQYQDSISSQFIGLTLILMSLLVLGIIKNNLISDWQKSLPQKAPNYFAFNIAPADLLPLQQIFQKYHVALEGIYPMVRGRLTALNNQDILSAIPPRARNNNALHRELNLSWMWQFPSDNKILQGSTWNIHNKGQALISVENELAADLNLKLGDQLTFQIGERSVSGKIINFRSVNWGSFHPNFFIIFSPGLLEDFPATYITSFHLSLNQTNLINNIIREFPNVTIIDAANLLQQAQNLLDKVITGIQYLFLFSLAAGGLIFAISIQTSMDERRKTYHLLRILGASKKYIIKSLFVEFSALTLLILFSSLLLGRLIAFLLARHIFNI